MKEEERQEERVLHSMAQIMDDWPVGTTCNFRRELIQH